MSTWQYWHAEIPDAPPCHRHVVYMATFVPKKKSGGQWMMVPFFGPTPEAAQAKVDAFWKERAQKAGRAAEGRVKAEATKAAKSASGAYSEEQTHGH